MKSVSVILATLNSGDILDKCLSSVRSQEYNQDKIEIIAADGGSTDATLDILKKYKAQIIPENTGNPEAAKLLALKKAKNEIILHIDDDTVLPNNKWLKNMLDCFAKEPEAVACYPWRYTYRKKDKFLNRYFALFGVNDPLAYFLKKADRQDYLPPKDKYKLKGKATDKGKYFLVEFNKNNLPTVGANGFLIKRKILNKVLQNKKHFFHIDANLKLVKKVFNKYIVVKNNVLHLSGGSLLKYLKKRSRYLNIVNLEQKQNRIYYTADVNKDFFMLVLFAIYANTYIGPLLVSFKGFLSKKDPAWFLHPIINFLIAWIYFINVLKSWLKK